LVISNPPIGAVYIEGIVEEIFLVDGCVTQPVVISKKTQRIIIIFQDSPDRFITNFLSLSCYISFEFDAAVSMKYLIEICALYLDANKISEMQPNKSLLPLSGVLKGIGKNDLGGIPFLAPVNA
jgi:hypothetical protein